MAVTLDGLDAAFREKVEQAIERCLSRGVEMRPYNGLRTPVEQGKLWRQSRAIEEIRTKMAELRDKSAPFLADCIDRAGPQHGAEVTKAVPGLSWHQWGEAVDCFWVVDGRAEWSTRKLIDGVNGYQVLADVGEAVGLTAGGHWPRFKDWPHLQLRPANNPLIAMSLVEIDAEMRRRFGP